MKYSSAIKNDLITMYANGQLSRRQLNAALKELNEQIEEEGRRELKRGIKNWFRRLFGLSTVEGQSDE